MRPRIAITPGDPNAKGARNWRSAPLTDTGNDRWAGEIVCDGFRRGERDSAAAHAGGC